MGLVGPGMYVSPGIFKVANSMMGRARKQVAEEVVTESHHPNGYAEGMRRENIQHGQMEGNSRQRGGRMTYASHVIRHRDGLTMVSKEVEWYDSDEHWHFGLDSSACSIDIGGSLANTLYICNRDG